MPGTAPRSGIGGAANGSAARGVGAAPLMLARRGAPAPAPARDRVTTTGAARAPRAGGAGAAPAIAVVHTAPVRAAAELRRESDSA